VTVAATAGATRVWTGAFDGARLQPSAVATVTTIAHLTRQARRRETVAENSFVRTISAMKRTILTALAAMSFLTVVAGSANATEVGYNRKFGLGVVLGAPTGFTGKAWVGPTNAIDFGLGFYGYGFANRCFTDSNGTTVCNRGGYNWATLNVDYLWQSNIVRGQAQLDWHLGAGGRATWIGDCQGDCARLGPRGSVGLDLMFNNPAFLELFFEIAFVMNVVPGIWLDIEGGLGVRFYF